jgi:hypothetical protein
MTDWEKAYVIQYPETFELRRDVLDAILPGRWELSPDGTRIKFDIHIDLYSYHERHIIHFARNPYDLAENVFCGLDRQAAVLLAEAIYRLFGPEGAIYFGK